jgi:mRNA-degrading endonuclease RelE of RelBE toxin-antitoxin system
MMKMIEFIESSRFAKQIAHYLSDEEFNELQQALLKNPESGAIIKGSGGIRKIRWGGKGKGKRGGYRIIYYYRSKSGQIYLLTIYAKSEMEDLTTKQLKTIAEEIER